MDSRITTILERYRSDRTRLIDILWDVQHEYGHIPDAVLPQLGAGLKLSPLDIRETASFYHFFLDKPSGKYRIYLCNSVIAKINGYQAVREALERETGIRFGETDPNGMFGLFDTPCIGLSDQEPAMLIDKVVFTRLRPGKITDIIAQLKQGRSPAEIANPAGLPSQDIAYVDAMVESNVRTKGPVFFRGRTDLRSLLDQCLLLKPEQVIETIVDSRLRGRGGAGFSTGLKWRLCRDAESEQKYVICNADEGEPGTFKDRVLLTRAPKKVFVGMVIAAYAIGCRKGIVYLRGEYFYLKDYLERQLQELREDGLLGRAIGGRAGFDFDIRIQMGAGAYICGDESALIESCEGKRGTPRVKPPFPVQQGYLGKPTSVNNVETFAAVSRIMEEGADWFRAMGTPDSAGTRLLSVAGDCSKPGIYEVEWGVTLNEVLAMVGARDARAVQISGPSGECVSVAKDGERKLAYEDLSCNGAFTIFNCKRDLLEIVRDHMQFFVEESCGICVPCRAGNVDLHRKVEWVIAGKACQKDLDDMVSWGALVRRTSRCGLGATSPKPILTTLEKFPEIYQNKLVRHEGPLLPSFDLDTALGGYEKALKDLEEVTR
ncbi:bidirectional NAD-reducing hydrogenase diaphorase subunit HoxF (plasmid) [Cupriavidus necator H16]|uniref:NAD-reducing hydrogenase HoxS subunit alpha n=2 Tax=Cupriavidus necator (strain ATCC 17699 / DSM 428 / KCTC 22496 / NCIMB 10442 / H16 / Stanier 337) TaxID=381666 RepID=HOXF_CUPNH|nr:bidirectional NAD-reducing hydrogenase diaphorase subunit HoxF [Cupriavidus necator]P22317.1 RecName: Full=NAD-reducing hydrogenase HoxS subunit alpha [Cupriavidus necator H16]AAC06140.1 NAD-reducing hydrogenase [Cupriavidus necator H16]AAP85841.1 NAD-reducing hydrogenase diaphorase moiety large subunit [Cupriavidus necator H16]QCC05348.1 NAD-reducing hydrogenase HoxS subunit alpha [Cupriavidus necator H16]QQB81517.1 bidirectional NAD-reducing hydrogenase diaphorase subunit HoxF [Cupriavidu